MLMIWEEFLKGQRRKRKQVNFIYGKEVGGIDIRRGGFVGLRFKTLFFAVSSFLSLSLFRKAERNNPFKKRKSNQFQSQWQINSPMNRSLSSRKPSVCSIRMEMVCFNLFFFPYQLLIFFYRGDWNLYQIFFAHFFQFTFAYLFHYHHHLNYNQLLPSLDLFSFL